MIEEFLGAIKKRMKIWDIILMTVVSKLVKIKNSCKFLVGHCDNVIRPIFSILPKNYFKNFKVEDVNKNNK